jgi:flagellar hook-length control protein FliK
VLLDSTPSAQDTAPPDRADSNDRTQAAPDPRDENSCSEPPRPDAPAQGPKAKNSEDARDPKATQNCEKADEAKSADAKDASAGTSDLKEIKADATESKSDAAADVGKDSDNPSSVIVPDLSVLATDVLTPQPVIAAAIAVVAPPVSVPVAPSTPVTPAAGIDEIATIAAAVIEKAGAPAVAAASVTSPDPDTSPALDTPSAPAAISAGAAARTESPQTAQEPDATQLPALAEQAVEPKAAKTAPAADVVHPSSPEPAITGARGEPNPLKHPEADGKSSEIHAHDAPADVTASADTSHSELRPELKLTASDTNSPARPAFDPSPNVSPSPAPGMAASSTATSTQQSTPNPATAAVPVPIAGLALEISARAQTGKNRFEIRLDPPELGRINVRLDVDRDGNVTSHLVVDRVETLDLLRRDAPNLERAFQQAGLKTSDNSLQFSLRDQAFSGRDNNGQPTPAMARLVVDDPLAPIETMQRSYGRLAGLRGGVDIRV